MSGVNPLSTRITHTHVCVCVLCAWGLECVRVFVHITYIYIFEHENPRGQVDLWGNNASNIRTTMTTSEMLLEKTYPHLCACARRSPPAGNRPNVLPREETAGCAHDTRVVHDGKSSSKGFSLSRLNVCVCIYCVRARWPSSSNVLFVCLCVRMNYVVKTLYTTRYTTTTGATWSALCDIIISIPR